MSALHIDLGGLHIQGAEAGALNLETIAQYVEKAIDRASHKVHQAVQTEEIWRSGTRFY